MKTVTIAVDAMGGDIGPSVTVPAALQMLRKHQKLHLILVGDTDVLKEQLRIHQKEKMMKRD